MGSQPIKHVIEGDCAYNSIPFPNVTSKIHFQVIEYCRKHVGAASSSSKAFGDASKNADELTSWDAEAVKVDLATLFDLTLASNQIPRPDRLQYISRPRKRQ